MKIEKKDWFIPVDLSALPDYKRSQACHWGEHPLEAFEQKASDLMIKGLIHSYYSLNASDLIPWTLKGDIKRQRSLGNYIRQSQRRICQNCVHWEDVGQFKFCDHDEMCRVYGFQEAWKDFLGRVFDDTNQLDYEYLERRVNHLESSMGKVWKNRNNWKKKAGGFDEE